MADNNIGRGSEIESDVQTVANVNETSETKDLTKVDFVKNPADGLVLNSKIKHRKEANGLINHILKAPEEYDQAESGDSGQGSSCQDCEHGHPDTDVSEVAAGLSSLSVSSQSQQAQLSPVSQRDIREGIEYVVYESEKQMPDIMRLITKDLSEPYSIYTYRYFIHNWPKLCFLAMDQEKCVGAIVCKLDMHKKMVRRGYIAMLAIDADYRRRKIGSNLVTKAIRAMIADDCDEVVLETEITNKAALRLYENLGFVRDKRLFRYYLNGVDALRLKLWLR
ncbi:N-alpha-acetyltransferase 30-like [Haliotis asinina]|uniref:N-alpha-acetyltransferase 30-like n=1 Tax=Haliotis asinina TaxID=109174 RepID=UPI00353227AA